MAKDKDMKFYEENPEINNNGKDHWDALYNRPNLLNSKKELEVQEALSLYPFENKTSVTLELYYMGASMKEIRNAIGSKAKNPRQAIQRAKKRVMSYYKNVVLAPIHEGKLIIVKKLDLSYDGVLKSALKVINKETKEIFWTTDSFVRLPDDVQDLLDMDHKYKDWDYVNVGQTKK